MRIIGGTVGGRTLRAPRGASTRPTSDKVREAIFNILVSFAGAAPARVLDLYAGSGALGLEALSRGAGTALFVDEERESCATVRANADALGFHATEVVCNKVVRFLAKHADAASDGERFGWIFLDPPYESHETGELDKALDLVERRALLSPNGIAVAEHPWRHAPGERYGALALADRRRYGQTAVSFYRHAAHEETHG